MNKNGRKYINYEKRIASEADCLTFKPVPMLVAGNLLNNATASRPRDIITLATSLAHINNLPVQVVLDKLEREVIQLVDKSVNNTWGFMMETGSETSSIPSQYMFESTSQEGTFDTPVRSLDKSQEMTALTGLPQGEVNRIKAGVSPAWGGRRMGSGRPTRAVKAYSQSEGIPVKEAKYRMSIKIEKQLSAPSTQFSGTDISEDDSEL